MADKETLPDTRPLSEDVNGHTLARLYEHPDGRLCGYHARLGLWIVNVTNDTLQCLRLHAVDPAISPSGDQVQPPPRHGGEVGLCEGKHYCTACRWGGCVTGEVCEDLHIGEDCTPTDQPGCSLSVACDCEPCSLAGAKIVNDIETGDNS